MFKCSAAGESPVEFSGNSMVVEQQGFVNKNGRKSKIKGMEKGQNCPCTYCLGALLPSDSWVVSRKKKR